MNSKKLSVQQNTLLNSFGSLFYLGCQWLLTVLVVRLGSVEDGGNLSLAMSLTNMFFTIATFGIRDFQVSDYQNKYSPSQYVTTRLLTCTVSSLICCGIVLLNRHYTGHQIACILFYMLFRISEALVDVFQAMEQKAERMDYNCVSFLLRGIFLLGGFSLILHFSGSLVMAIVGIAVTSFCVVLGFDWPTCRKLSDFKLEFSFSATRHLLLECAPLMCNSFLTSAIVSIPRSTLETLWGSYWMGIYGSVATPATIVQSAAMWLYTPAILVFTRHYVERDKKNFYALYRKIWLILGGVFIAVFVGAALLGRWGLGLLFNDEVVAHADLLIPVLGTTLLIAVSYFLGAILTITRQLKVILAANAVAAALAVVLSRPIIQSCQMNGVNYVIYIAMGANVLLLLIALTRNLHHYFKNC